MIFPRALGTRYQYRFVPCSAHSLQGFPSLFGTVFCALPASHLLGIPALPIENFSADEWMNRKMKVQAY